MTAILFSCTFALAAKGYKIHHHLKVICLYEEQNETIQSEHNRLQYFTQRVLYNFYSYKVKNIFWEVDTREILRKDYFNKVYKLFK